MGHFIVIVIGAVLVYFMVKNQTIKGLTKNSKDINVPLTEEEKEVVNSLVKNGYKFFFKDKYATYVTDKDNIYTLTKSGARWILKKK